jgi:Putative transposase
MTLTTDEFIRRFLIHLLPKEFHRIRHYGLFAKAAGTDNIARAAAGTQPPHHRPA